MLLKRAEKLKNQTQKKKLKKVQKNNLIPLLPRMYCLKKEPLPDFSTVLPAASKRTFFRWAGTKKDTERETKKSSRSTRNHSRPGGLFCAEKRAEKYRSRNCTQKKPHSDDRAG